jgi:hypothetical protein
VKGGEEVEREKKRSRKHGLALQIHLPGTANQTKPTKTTMATSKISPEGLRDAITSE